MDPTSIGWTRKKHEKEEAQKGSPQAQKAKYKELENEEGAQHYYWLVPPEHTATAKCRHGAESCKMLGEAGQRTNPYGWQPQHRKTLQEKWKPRPCLPESQGQKAATLNNAETNIQYI